MAVLTKNEIMEKLKGIIGDKNDDETLAFIEDVNDTFEDKEKDGKVDWQKKYEDNDKEWREKYKKRFFENSGDEDDEIEDNNTDNSNETEEKPLTFESLFETKKEE